MRNALRNLALLAAAASLFTTSLQATAQEKDSTSDRKVITRVIPAYPELAMKSRVRGTVRILATVAPNGKVKSTRLLGGSPVLAKAAEDAIEKWKFAAAADETQELIELRFSPE